MKQIVSALIVMWWLFSAGIVFAADQVQPNPLPPATAEPRNTPSALCNTW